LDSFRSWVPEANHFVAALVNIQAPSFLVQRAKLGIYNVFTEMFAAFAVGAALFSLRRWVTLRWELALLALAAWFGTVALGGAAPEIGAVVLGPYLVMYLAYSTHTLVRLPRRFGDYSYGTYIYAFPVQQTISLVLYPIGGWLMFLVATPITLALAIPSWHFVERPALNMKHRITGAESPAGTGPPRRSEEARGAPRLLEPSTEPLKGTL
jgi:peptidoglycan/LPS O-acetylase OafA/YrhL